MSYTFQRLERGVMPPYDQTMAEQLAKAHNMSLGDAERYLRKELEGGEVWLNDTYQVNVRRYEEYTHLSLKRRDKAPVTDWRDKQEIKNQLVGPENEGLELYPAESRLVDAANQYHIWVLNDSTSRIPLGWERGLVETKAILNARQRR